MKKLIILGFFLVGHHYLHGQNLGVNVMAGPYLSATNGINDIDGVLIDARDNSNNEVMFALSGIYNYNKWIGLYLETGIFKAYSNLLVQDLKEACQFCPVEKRYLLNSTKLDIFFGPTISFNVIPYVQTKVYVGPNFFINLKEHHASSSFNGNHLRTEEVMNSLNNSQISTISISYGGLVSYKRFFISAKYTRNLKLTDKVDVFGSTYSLNTWLDILQVKIGYTLLYALKEE